MFTKKKKIGWVGVILSACMVLSSCSGQTIEPVKNAPIAVNVWHYYSGPQQQAFHDLVREYNETMGSSKNVAVYAKSYGGINDLVTALNAAVDKKVGAEEVPEIFAAYADTAFELNKKGVVADIAKYLTEEEKAMYVSDFLEEGKFDGETLKILPIAKSTEVMAINKTAWDEFSKATGTEKTQLSTWEGITEVAQKYYQYTDGLTPEPDDGKAFFGRDAFANYILIGAKQLGKEMFSPANGQVTFALDNQVMQKLWENYYVPMVQGWFAEKGKFRSDDMKTGTVIALVCSTSGSAFLPHEVSDQNGVTTPIEVETLPLPNFVGTQPYAVQQGAGMVVSKGDQAEEKAAVDFLKWFTQPEQNIRFSLNSGYLPSVVLKDAQIGDIVQEQRKQNTSELNDNLWQSLEVAGNMQKNYRLYTNQPFENGYAAREIVNTYMHKYIREDLEFIQGRMAQGVSRQEAFAEIKVQERFEQWVKEMGTALEATKTSK